MLSSEFLSESKFTNMPDRFGRWLVMKFEKWEKVLKKAVLPLPAKKGMKSHTIAKYYT